MRWERGFDGATGAAGPGDHLALVAASRTTSSLASFRTRAAVAGSEEVMSTDGVEPTRAITTPRMYSGHVLGSGYPAARA